MELSKSREQLCPLTLKYVIQSSINMHVQSDSDLHFFIFKF